LIQGGGKKDPYLSEMITHVVADDTTEDDYQEAKELFELPVVSVSFPSCAYFVLKLHSFLADSMGIDECEMSKPSSVSFM
jgi:hypothetical protein